MRSAQYLNFRHFRKKNASLIQVGDLHAKVYPGITPQAVHQHELRFHDVARVNFNSMYIRNRDIGFLLDEQNRVILISHDLLVDARYG